MKLLEMVGITKHFVGVLANDNINFDLNQCEIHTLLGENGAGKSTLMKILYGLYNPDEGEIRLRGETIEIKSPSDAIRHGIGMVHQHFMLVPTLTVAENVSLGLRSSRHPLTDLPAVSKRITELSELYSLKVDPDTYIWQLAMGERQRVEILKALYRNASVLVLDEPTAALTPQEVAELIHVLKKWLQTDGDYLHFPQAQGSNGCFRPHYRAARRAGYRRNNSCSDQRVATSSDDGRQTGAACAR